MVLLLDFARGLAALWVFLLHIKHLYADAWPLMYQFSSYGHLGVPMFFVISGYVITYSAESKLKANKPPFGFLKNRFLRIYPAFWASVIVILLLPYLLAAIGSLKTGTYVLPNNVLSEFNMSEWLNLLMLTKVFFATSSDLALEFKAVNVVYWTLAIEFQFYLVIFLAMHMGRYYRHAIAVVSLVSLVLYYVPNNLNSGLFVHYWPSFMVGIVLAYLHKRGHYFHLKSFLGAMPLLVFIAACLILIATASSTQLHTGSFLFATFFGLLLWFSSGIEKNLQRMRHGGNALTYWLLEPWLILGAMSYSLYLLHVKLFLIPQSFVSQFIEPDSIFFSICTILGTLLLCYPFYYFVERRFLSNNLKTIHQHVMRAPTTAHKHSKESNRQ